MGDATGSRRERGRRGFYIFTIITNCTHQIIILRMPPTSIAAVRNLTYIFATFAHVAATVACHASAELAGPLRRVPDVTGRWAQPAAANPMPFGPLPSVVFFFFLQMPTRPSSPTDPSHRHLQMPTPVPAPWVTKA